MSHHHHHTQQVSDRKTKNILILSIVANLLFVATETVVGIWKDSLSLLSDAGHNLSDVFSLVLVLVGVYPARRAA
ncbi:MAG: cation transporter, partial [Bacteroidales bacterium]|nr:cation transporter [Bacteroidales bacterium]